MKRTAIPLVEDGFTEIDTGKSCVTRAVFWHCLMLRKESQVRRNPFETTILVLTSMHESTREAIGGQEATTKIHGSQWIDSCYGQDR